MIGARKMADALKLYDLKEIRGAINVLFADVKVGDGECIEVRIFDKKKKLVVSGWFDDMNVMAEAIAFAARDGVSGGGYRFVQDNVYWTVNPVNDALLSRQPKNTFDFVSESTSDSNITRRLWLPIDIDPKRPSGVSATHEERTLARQVANDMFTKLDDLGFTENMYVGGTSGNGYHVNLRIDMPNDKETADFLRDCLKGLNELVGTGKVDIDPKVFNAARILKAYGTIARKGVNDERRPWRMSKLSMAKKRKHVLGRGSSIHSKANLRCRGTSNESHLGGAIQLRRVRAALESSNHPECPITKPIRRYATRVRQGECRLFQEVYRCHG
jgi:hypothetical protein